MKKILIALILSVSLCLGLNSNTYVFGDTIETEILSDEDYVALVIKNSSNVNITPTASYVMLDTAGNTTYLCVEFDCENTNHGFAILDLSTYEVVMYALDAKIPFSEEDRIVYNGYLRFASLNEDNTATILNSQVTINQSLLFEDNSRANLTIAPANIKNEKIQKELSKSNDNNEQLRSTLITVSGGLDTNLVYNAGTNSGSWTTDCGINAVAIFLRHMDSYFNNNYVPDLQSTESALKVVLAGIAYYEFGQTTSLSMNNLASLSNIYMDTYSGTGTSYVLNYIYSWLLYSMRINNGNGKPCILYLGGGTTSYWTTAHAVVGVGYTSDATSSSGYDIVNSGWDILGYVQISTSAPGYMIK